MTIIGHISTKSQLDEAIVAAKSRNVALPHMLFTGSPGCGKTTLAQYVATVSDAPFLSVVPNDLKDRKTILSILDRLNHTNYDELGNRTGPIKPTILFLDEIHNLPKKGQELLGLVMERFRTESTRPNMYQWVPFFTLIGATTIAGKLEKPFRDRFKFTFLFSPYKDNEMVRIIYYHANRLNIIVTPVGAKEIAKRSRGVPRIAVGFLERIRDRVVARKIRCADGPLVKSVFEDLDIDEEGFNRLEIKLLRILHNAGQPVSLDNLSIILQEDPKSIEGFAQPYLIKKGMILVSGKGRVITEKGAQYLNSSGQTSKLVKKEITFDYERS
jgi:Holliday junction DNA helicase RuvB